ncbi:MAG TPA: restriction endonuclease [Paracoccaceae bacterium]|nr:restriction endonuclease [Paracoccaceae bacterium]
MALASVLALCACVEQPLPGFSGIPADEAHGSGALRAPATAIDPGLARAPEVFRASGIATWDGNRTVGGLWVAHPAALRSRRVRVVDPETGAEVDAMLYRPQRSRLAEGGDVVTVSSDVAEAMGLVPGAPQRLALFGLRPKAATSARQRRATATMARSELASHIARMEPDRLLQVIAAAMRGMGYRAVFEPADQGALPEIRADPDADEELQPIRVVVRPADMAPMSARDLAERQALLTNSGDPGVVVSIAGFAEDAHGGLDPAGARLELVDLEELLEIWTTNYESLSAPDRALLPLQPVWFLAAEEAGRTDDLKWERAR